GGGDLEAEAGGGQLHSDAAAAGGQGVLDADRGHFLDQGAGDGGDGAGGAGDREGGGRSGDRGDPPDAQDGGDGGGDVPQAAGRGAGGGQHRGAAAGRRQRRSRARASAGEDRLHHAAQEVQSGSVRADERRGGAAYAVLQRVPAAVLFSDDGRDGGVHVAERGGDGDAGGQRDDDDRADHADRDGEGGAVRHSRGGAHGGRRRRHRDRGVEPWSPWPPIRRSASVSRPTIITCSIGRSERSWRPYVAPALAWPARCC